MAGQQTMSSQIGDLTGQKLHLQAMLASHIMLTQSRYP